MTRILLVFGTRPEAIKLAPVAWALGRHADRFEVALCSTAQHRQMLDQILATFGIVPDFDLDLMTGGQDLHDITTRALAGLKPVLRGFRPGLVLVQGDTTTTFSAALAAFYERIPVGHVEAGLRTGDIHSPWPEEMNRRLTTRLARWHFAPTAANRDALLAEGVAPADILVTGNTVIDALLWVRERLAREPARAARARAALAEAGFLPDPDRRLVLITGHRRESFGQGFAGICAALRALAAAHPELDLVYPVHLNPAVREPVTAALAGQANIHLIAPLAYEPFVWLMGAAHLILTDSGGIQEEAPALGKPTLVLRAVTERPEALAAGTARLVGTDPARIQAEAERLLADPAAWRRMATARNPYGDGSAAAKIAAFMAERL
jgi:UDP-N-acetylglucosamine 2-epimerase